MHRFRKHMKTPVWSRNSVAEMQSGRTTELVQDTEYNAVVFELFRRIYTWRHIPAERSARPLTVELLGKEGPGILVTK